MLRPNSKYNPPPIPHYQPYQTPHAPPTSLPYKAPDWYTGTTDYIGPYRCRRKKLRWDHYKILVKMMNYQRDEAYRIWKLHNPIRVLRMRKGWSKAELARRLNRATPIREDENYNPTMSVTNGLEILFKLEPLAMRNQLAAWKAMKPE